MPFGERRTRRARRPASAGRASGASAAGRGPAPPPFIPYDYAATFELTGEPGTVREDVIKISSEGVFVAYAIGYGLEEDRDRTLSPALTPAQSSGVFRAGDLTLSQLPVAALIEGFRVNPRERFVQDDGSGAEGSVLEREYTAASADRILRRVKPAEEVSFLFSLVDTATGRELQDEPANNLASLGKSRGERPFRPLARPLSFLPRSTVRVQIIERSQGVRGTLFIVLHGYKLLGADAVPESAARALTASAALPGMAPGQGPGDLLPFDYVVSLDLEGRPGNTVSEEIAISVDGAFVTTHIGYGLQAEAGRPGFRVADAPKDSAGLVQLDAVPLKLFPEAALLDGLRVRPEYRRIVFTQSGQLAPLPVDLAGQIFESLNQPEDVQFRYMIFDGGRGRELQDKLIFNLAGLGSADGDRPFKKFPKPMVFLPRTTLRFNVEEHFGRGRLYFAFQGYKLLRPAAARGTR